VKFATTVATATMLTSAVMAPAAAAAASVPVPTAGQTRFNWRSPSNQARELDRRHDLLSRLEGFGALADGWAGYADSQAPSANSLEEARELLFELSDDVLWKSRLAVAPDGEISLIWESRDLSKYAELAVAGDGYLAIYLEENGASLPMSQDIVLEALPPEISTYIRATF
jgi:hypothetical protein